ncbi:hypothetical protein FHS29_004982 [Saccharothrix tamanrassetensis]|uniref:Uncharacterized protein n=1 Tax=Saccharothrix tamanrassetensis TaxID=1051531 RepID=A0A841CPT9_9PSEU|nr:hypothetical protein [Saccharothrix tamanrassetensis]MBB5958374.1 hypothetical protein [Saccharothrix tamanrassetensis]
MSLTPIYDDLLREFEGIIEASADVEAEAADTAAAPVAPAEAGD